MPKTASKPIIAIDIDDVLAGTTEALRLFVNRRHKLNLTEEHYRVEGEYWSYYETVWKQHGIDESNLKDIFHDGMHLDQSSIQPIADSVSSIKVLSKKYDLIAMTSRPDAMKDETLKWLEVHFKDIFTKPPIFLGFGPGIRRTKGEVCAELGALYLVDDNVEHCKTALEKGVKAVLFGDYGWHQKIPANIVRCKNWKEVLEFFNVAC